MNSLTFSNHSIIILLRKQRHLPFANLTKSAQNQKVSVTIICSVIQEILFLHRNLRIMEYILIESLKHDSFRTQWEEWVLKVAEAVRQTDNWQHANMHRSCPASPEIMAVSQDKYFLTFVTSLNHLFFPSASLPYFACDYKEKRHLKT